VFSGGFKRSGLFGLIGVVVVMIAVALIALNADSGDPNPKGTMALSFGVIAVFVVILFVFQRTDWERVAGGNA
jgi:Mn2+/Fe2+ NRAMP family transporter